MLFSLLLMGAAACSPDAREDGPDGSTNPPTIDGGPGPDAPPNTNGPPYHDFPSAPILDVGVPANIPELMNVPSGISAGPCLAEPQFGTLFPNNFLRPRFKLVPPANQNIFEIRLHADDEANDLVVYTKNPLWTIPGAIWANMSLNISNRIITVSVRGASLSADGTALTSQPSAATLSQIQIAPVAATGTIVYWTTSNGTALKGMQVDSDMPPAVVLRPKNTGTAAAPAPGDRCIGCHHMTPDGEFIGFSLVNGSDGRPGKVDLRKPMASTDPAIPTDPAPVAERPSILTPQAIEILEKGYQHTPVFSPAHWSDGDRIAVTIFQPQGTAGAEYGGPTQIAWTNLETTSTEEGIGWGMLARNGDTNNAAAATFSHDGLHVAYASGTNVDSGVRNSFGDIRVVPFNNGAGGDSVPLDGANDPNFNECYPAYSADDQLVAFTRTNLANIGNPQSYDNASAEIWVVPSAGGQAVRLLANEPNNACGPQGMSPGVTNSWPQWSPGPVESRDGSTYYFLTFSSRRGPGFKPNPQIYVTPIVVTEGIIETYPAIYLWSQPSSEANHTPAWNTLTVD